MLAPQTPGLHDGPQDTSASDASTDHERGKKERLTLYLPAPLIERVRNVVFWEPGMTLAAFGEAAIRQAVEEMESQRGSPYPRRRQNLKVGRPAK